MEEVLGTSSGCLWVFQSQPPWTVRTILGPRTSTLSPWRASKVASTACPPHVLVTWWWPLSRKGSLISERRSYLPLSWGNASRGAERMEFICTSKVVVSPYVDMDMCIWFVWLLRQWKSRNCFNGCDFGKCFLDLKGYVFHTSPALVRGRWRLRSWVQDLLGACVTYEYIYKKKKNYWKCFI